MLHSQYQLSQLDLDLFINSSATENEATMTAKDEFLHPRSRYHGQIKPEELVFNANLQEFTQRISFICNLQTNGKLSAEASYQQVKDLWQQLERTSNSLKITERVSHASPQWEDYKVVSITSDVRSYL